MDAEVIAIGDEITSGQTLDTNSQWLSQRLEELGIRVLYHTTAGDELLPNVDVFRHAIERADVVIATGGLGPTADDLTREALAQATGRPLQLDPVALEYIRTLFARRHRPMPRQNELQAMFPEGSRVVYNPHGTAPGIDLEVPRAGKGSCRVICLPGVPAEMVEMWNDSVAATIKSLCGPGRVIRRRSIRCFGAGESQIESMLPDLIRRGRQPTVGITASKATITLRIMAEGQTDAECEAAIGPVVETIKEALGNIVYGEETDELQDVVVRLLRRQKKTLVTCECATGGLLAEWLASVPDAGGTYLGGAVLTRMEETVEEVAVRHRRTYRADVALAVGPVVPASQGLPSDARGNLPSVVVAMATGAGVEQKIIPLGIHPALEKIYAAKQALNCLRLALLEITGG